MIEQTLNSIEDLYTKNLDKYGKKSSSVGWLKQDEQTLRFEKLLGCFNTNNLESLNDLGSGYGAVLDYLAEKNIKLTNYNAYDISEAMLDNIDVYDGININKFKNKFIETAADYSIASGIFNVKFDSTDAEWQKNMLTTLDNLNAFSRKGFSFNVLTSYVDYKEPHLYYADPCFFFDYCKKHFSKKVTLIHDYPLWEWSLVVIKE